jgi:membrane associated rhomboid family serine protease
MSIEPSPAMRAFLIIPLFLPVGVEYHTRRFPVVTFTIMGLCAAVHLLAMFIWFNGGDEADLDFMLTLGFVRETPNAYSWLTHMFTHGDIFHLLGNMIYLFLFGSCVEDLLGRVRYVIFYLLGGLAALAIFLLLAPEPLPGEPPVPLVGASGAISACMGAFFLVLHHARITIKWIVFFFFRIFSGDWHLPAKLVMSFWFLLDVLGMIISLDDTGGGVAFSAHVGGFLAGLGLMAVIKHGFGLLTDDQLDLLENAQHPRPRARAVAEPATIYLLANEAQSGPFTRGQIQQMNRLGALEAGTLYWEEGMAEWRSLEEL